MHDDRYSHLFAEDPEIADHRYVLQDRYLELTRISLPAKGLSSGWSIRDDHCFMRIILDQLFQDCWYNHLDRRLVAYKQLTNPQLKSAIELAHSILQHGDEVLESWNRQSLEWRQK